MPCTGRVSASPSLCLSCLLKLSLMHLEQPLRTQARFRSPQRASQGGSLSVRSWELTSPRYQFHLLSRAFLRAGAQKGKISEHLRFQGGIFQSTEHCSWQGMIEKKTAIMGYVFRPVRNRGFTTMVFFDHPDGFLVFFPVISRVLSN